MLGCFVLTLWKKKFVVAHYLHALGQVCKFVLRCKNLFRIGPWTRIRGILCARDTTSSVINGNTQCKIQLLFSCILPQKKMWAVQTVNLFVSKIEEGSRHSVWYSSHCGAHPIQCFLEFNIFRGLLLLPTFWPKKCQFVMVSAIQFARPILEHCTGILSDELSLIKLWGSEYRTFSIICHFWLQQ